MVFFLCKTRKKGERGALGEDFLIYNNTGIPVRRGGKGGNTNTHSTKTHAKREGVHAENQTYLDFMDSQGTPENCGFLQAFQRR